MEETTKLVDKMQILITSSFVFLIFFLAAWRNGYFHSSRPQITFEKLSLKAFAWAFGLFFFIQVLFIPLSFEFWYYFYTLGSDVETMSPEIKGWYAIYAIVVTALSLFLYYFCLSKVNRQIILGDYALKGWIKKLQDFFIACMSWILSYPLIVSVGQVVAIIIGYFYHYVEPEQVAVKQIKMAATSETLLVTLSVLVVTIVPMIEEFLFRGLFQNWLKGYMQPAKAIVVASIVFAFFHFAPAQGMGNIEVIFSLFVLSCFVGFIYERQKSIWAPMSLHAIFNAVSIALIFYLEK